MNWTKISDNYKKAWDCFIHHKNGLNQEKYKEEDFIKDDTPTIERMREIKQKEVSGLLNGALGYGFYNPIFLLYFFDSQNIKIGIGPYYSNKMVPDSIPTFEGFGFTVVDFDKPAIDGICSEDEDDDFQERTEAETAAFEQAFILLEEKLK